MQLRITIAMLEIRNRKTLQSKVNICKSDVKIDDYADSLIDNIINSSQLKVSFQLDLFRTILGVKQVSQKYYTN